MPCEDCARLSAELADAEPAVRALHRRLQRALDRADRAEAAIARVRDWAAHIGYTHEWGMIQDEFFSALGGE